MSNKYSSYRQFLEDNTKKNSNIPDRGDFKFSERASSPLNGLYGLSPSLPLTFSREGPYDLLVELRDVVKQNFKNLMLTEPGERIMDANFGVGLKRYLFENVTISLQEEIKRNINAQKERYMPYLNIDDIQIENSDQQPNYMDISIYYSIPSLSIQDALSVAIGE